MARVEVLGAVERRRRWRYEDKVRIVEESFAPGARVVDVAYRNGIAASLVFTWRRQAKTGELGGTGVAPLLVPVELEPAALAQPATALLPVPWRTEIILVSGRRIIVEGMLDTDAVLKLARGLEAIR